MSNVLECSSKGDQRFSAFYAKVRILSEEKTIEKWYQEAKRFNNERVVNADRNKGRCPDYIVINIENQEIKLDTMYLSSWYKFLWIMYFVENRVNQYFEYILTFDDYNDMFKGKNTVNCQADVIREISKNGLYKTLFSIEYFVIKTFIALNYRVDDIYDHAKIIDKDNNLYKGHVLLASLSSLKDTRIDNYDLKLFIVRSPGKAMNSLKRYDFIHVPQLSPSLELFKTYQNRWLNNDFTEAEKEYMDKGNTHTWWDLYMKQFKYEMTHRHDLQLALKTLIKRLNEGKDIILVCFCPNFARCHRGLIGYYLNSLGYDVRFYAKEGIDKRD